MTNVPASTVPGTKHEGVLAWVEEMAALCQPDQIVWCDGSEAEKERLTQQVADAIEEAIQPQGVAVILEAQYLCMMMRGVEKQHSSTITSAMLGVFKTQLQTRNEFLSLVRGTRNGI